MSEAQQAARTGDGVRVAWPCDLGDALSEAFFARDTAEVARDLLGRMLVSRAGGEITGGRIVETEAYLGADDAGSHAATRGITARNATMYGPPGVTYVYFTYGNHHMLNLVTERAGTAGAVLIRAIEPLIGLEVMRSRRPGRVDGELANGPGKLAAALGLTLGDNGKRLGDGNVQVFTGSRVADADVAHSGRIGLSAGHDLHLRFYIDGSEHVSKGRTGPKEHRRRSGTHRTEEGAK